MHACRVFIGSASESRGIVDPIELELRDVARFERWDLDTFRPGHFTLEELTRRANEVDFAVFLLGREDETTSRGRAVPSPRDNVIFEAGLFTAALGRDRVFYIIDKQGAKIPSDWGGLGELTFDPSEERLRDQILEAADKIRKRIKEAKTEEGAHRHATVVGHWWQFVE